MDKPQLYPRNYRTLGTLVECEFSDRVKATAKAEGTNVKSVDLSIAFGLFRGEGGSVDKI